MRRLFRDREIQRTQRQGDDILIRFFDNAASPTILYMGRRYHVRVPVAEYRMNVQAGKSEAAFSR